MLKNDAEYTEKVKLEYNESIKECLKSPWSFEVWKKAFAAGFDAARNPEDDERFKAASVKKYDLKIETKDYEI